MPQKTSKIAVRALSVVLPLLIAACAQVNVPDPRSVDIPTVTPPLERYKGLNEKRDPVTRVKLGKDVLVPQPLASDPLPADEVGPYELRGETLASALQLILDDYDISLAFESDLAMTNRITIANLRGNLDRVINRVCELGNLYCQYDNGVMVVKETETFVVDLPPLASTAAASTGTTGTTGTAAAPAAASSAGSYTDIASGLQAITGTLPTVDPTTRVMIYTTTQRANKYAQKYFERLRKNTALIIYETHIWEVALNNENRTGIDWNSLFSNVGNWDLDINIPGGAPAGAAAPISITPTYTAGGNVTADAVLEFISEHGTVKTVSQPQLTVLSGSSASLTVNQSENFVSGISRTPSADPLGEDTVSTTTDTVETGLSMSVSSAWDQSTVYGTINIQLDELLEIDEFNPDPNTTIQLPNTTTRTLATQIRVRPGDAVLIAGLVTERDDYSASGPGFLKPLLQTARGAETRNTELIFLLRPRVIAFVPGDDTDTVTVVDAKKEQAFTPSDITGDVGALFGGEESEAVPAAVLMPIENEAKLPLGISAADLAPAPAEPSPAAAENEKEEEPVRDQPEMIPLLPAPSTAPISVMPAPEQQEEEIQEEARPRAPEEAPLPSWLPSQRGGRP